MNKVKENKAVFYLKIFEYGLLIGLCIWLPRIFSFFWGNHDWPYVKNGILIDDGLFEARYSQPLPMVLFFNGQILPVLLLLFTICFLIAMSILIARYLDIPKTIFSYLLLVSVVVSLPHIAILFYFVHYMFSLAFWGCVGVGLLFLSEEKYKIWKFLCGMLGVAILLGSYPPILALLGVLFVGKRIFAYVNQQQDMKRLLINIVFCSAQLIGAFLIYKCILAYFVSINRVNTGMYNLSTYTVWEVLRHIPTEFVAAFNFLADLQRSFGNIYGFFFTMLLFCGVGFIFYKAKNKIVALLLIVVLLLVSRLPFLLAGASYIAYFRVCLWGELGLIVVCLATLLAENRQYIRNLLWALGIVFVCYFVRIDLEIQKVQQFMFYSERLFQKRVEEKLFAYPSFDLKNKYITLNFGYPKFQQHFCYNDCKGFNNDVLDKTVLEAYFGQVIFWDEVMQPSVIKLGVWGGIMYLVDSSLGQRDVFQDNVQNIRYWAYMNAEKYPFKTALYVDNVFLIFVFDKIFFDKNKEIVLHQLQIK